MEDPTPSATPTTTIAFGVTLVAIILLGALVVASLLGSPFAFWQDQLVPEETPTIIPTERAPTPTSAITATHIYTNTPFHFSTHYPDLWRVSENPEKNSIMFYDPEYLPDPEALHTAQRFCVVDNFPIDKLPANGTREKNEDPDSEVITLLRTFLKEQQQLSEEQLDAWTEVPLGRGLVSLSIEEETQTTWWFALAAIPTRIICQSPEIQPPQDDPALQVILDHLAPVVLPTPTPSSTSVSSPTPINTTTSTPSPPAATTTRAPAV